MHAQPAADISTKRINMNKLLKVIFAASAVVAASASAQTMTEYMAKKPYSGYLQTQRDVIVRSGTGLCWHTGYWTPAAGQDSFCGIYGMNSMAIPWSLKA